MEAKPPALVGQAAQVDFLPLLVPVRPHSCSWGSKPGWGGEDQGSGVWAEAQAFSWPFYRGGDAGPPAAPCLLL